IVHLHLCLSSLSHASGAASTLPRQPGGRKRFATSWPDAPAVRARLWVRRWSLLSPFPLGVQVRGKVVVCENAGIVWVVHVLGGQLGDTPEHRVWQHGAGVFDRVAFAVDDLVR